MERQRPQLAERFKASLPLTAVALEQVTGSIADGVQLVRRRTRQISAVAFLPAVLFTAASVATPEMAKLAKPGSKIFRVAAKIKRVDPETGNKIPRPPKPTTQQRKATKANKRFKRG